MKKLLTAFLLLVAGAAFAVTPTVSNITGTVTTGQTITIAGTHMMDESQSSWVPFHATNPTAGQMQGTSLIGMGFDTPHNADWVADTGIKLFGTKSFKNHTSGQIVHVAPDNFAHAGDFSIFGPTDMGSASVTSDVWFRIYARFDVGANGEWPNTFGGGSNDFKIIGKWPGGGGPLGFWSSLDVPDSIGVPPSGIRLTPTNAPTNLHSNGPTIAENRWYCIELKAPLNSNNHIWQIYVDGALVYSQDLGQGVDFTGDINQWYGFFVNWYSTSSAFDQFIWVNGVAAKNNSRILPSSMVEIGNSSNYATAQKVYQAPEFFSDTSHQVKVNLAGLGAGPYFMWVTNNLGERSAAFQIGGTPDITPPVLTSPTAGVPNSTGTVNATVSTGEDNLTLYWAVVSNGSAPSVAQIIAGTGGGIQVAGNQTIIGTGVQTIPVISGLVASTLYQIKLFQRDTAGNDSTPITSVNLTTTAADVTPPLLTNVSSGTATSNGTANARVDTNEATGTLYWAACASPFSCTDAQLKAGTGGNIVAGSAGNQPVNSTGTKTIPTISGLLSSTLYQIRFLHRDVAGNDSIQASASITTTASSGVLLFSEPFDNASFAARGWFDTTTGTIDTTTFSQAGGNSSLRISWTQGSTSPTTPKRHSFTATEIVYVSYWQKLGSASVTWQGSGVAYHPHTFQLLTDADDDWIGPSNTNLSVRLDLNVFTPRFNISDGLRMFLTNPYPSIAGTYPHNNSSPSLLGTSSTHAVMGGNGKQVSSAAYYDAGGAWENTADWTAASPALTNNTWHHIEVYVAMNSVVNSVPQANGILRYWVDGALVMNYTNVYLRTAQSATQKFNKLLLVPYIGVGSPIAQDMWIDNLEVWNLELPSIVCAPPCIKLPLKF